MEENKEKVKKKRLTPESTMLLAIGACALVVVVFGIVYWIFSS